MTTERNIIIHQGQAFELSLDYAGAPGRSQRMHIRLADQTATIVQALSHNGAANARVTYNDSTQQLDITIGATVSAAWVVLADRVEWTYDIEDYDPADEDDTVIPYRGKVIVRGNRTRPEDATLSPQMPNGDSRYTRFDGDQNLTPEQMAQAQINILGEEYAPGGGSGDVVGPASATDDRIAAFDGVTGKLIKQGGVTATAVASHLSSTSNPHSVTAAQVGADPTGTAAAAVVAHTGATDPHGDRAFATSAVSTHSALTTGAHGITAAGAALLDDADAAAQRTTLGLGTAATQASSAFEASGAIATHNAVTTAHGISAFGATLVDDADAAAARTTLGLGTAATAATGAFEAAGGIATHAALTTGAHGITAAGAALLDDVDAAAQRTTLGLVIGTDVQAYDAELAAIASLTSAADSAPYFTGSGTAALMTVTAAARSVLDDTTTAAMLTTLGAQAALVSGTNIKTINSTSLLGSGDIAISASPGGSSGQFQFNDAAAFGGANLWRESADIVALRNGATAETLYVYNTYTDTSNYERGYLKWDTNVFEVGAQVAGTGTARTMRFRPSNASRYMQLDTNCNLSFIGGGSIASTINGTGGNCYFNAIYPSTSNNAIGYIYGDLTGSGTVFSFSGKDHANRGAFQLLAGTHAADNPANVTSTISGKNAFASASTNLAGGGVAIIGGAGASGSAGAATGGGVYLDGGQGYGTGAHGDVYVGNTRGKLQVKQEAIFTKSAQLANYTIATLPSASTAGAGALIYVSDETGGAVVAFSDATNWRRVTDRAICA